MPSSPRPALPWHGEKYLPDRIVRPAIGNEKDQSHTSIVAALRYGTSVGRAVAPSRPRAGATRKKVHLVAIPKSSEGVRQQKRSMILKHHGVRGPFLFLILNLLDNRSVFSAPSEVTTTREGNDSMAEVCGAVAIANAIAYVCEAIDPSSIFIGLTRRDLMSQSIRYLRLARGRPA